MDEEIAKQQANRFPNHHFNKIFLPYPQKAHSIQPLFLLTHVGAKEKASKRKRRVREAPPHTPPNLFEKRFGSKNFKTKWADQLMKPSPAGKGDRLRWMRRSPTEKQSVLPKEPITLSRFFF